MEILTYSLPFLIWLPVALVFALVIAGVFYA